MRTINCTEFRVLLLRAKKALAKLDDSLNFYNNSETKDGIVKEGIYEIEKVSKTLRAKIINTKTAIEKIKDALNIISENDPSGELIEIDFEKMKKYWIDFYSRYGINTSGLEDIRLTFESLQKAKELVKEYGFDKIVIIPDISFSDLVGIEEDGKFINEEFVYFRGKDRMDGQKTGNSGAINMDSRILNHPNFKQKAHRFKVVFLKQKDILSLQDAVDTVEDYTIQKILEGKPKLLEKFDFIAKANVVQPTTKEKRYGNLKKMEEFLTLNKGRKNEVKIEGIDEITAVVLDREYFDKTGVHLFDITNGNNVLCTNTIGKYAGDAYVRVTWLPGAVDGKWGIRLWLAEDSGVQGSVFASNLEYEKEE